MAVKEQNGKWFVVKKNGSLGTRGYKSQAAAKRVQARGKALAKGAVPKKKSSAKGGKKKVAKETKKHSKGNALSPVTKAGQIKATTAGIELAMGLAWFETNPKRSMSPAAHFAQKRYDQAIILWLENLNPLSGSFSGKLAGASVGTKIVARMIGQSNASFGPVKV